MDEELCWKAVTERDADADGRFFYGVLSTGVYCCPSCASRQPLRRNVRFYASAAAAEADGLRACKRCQPLEAKGNARMAQRMQALCRWIEAHAQEPLTLEALAAHVHLSPFHLQRQFKAVVGVSPKQYLEACRLRTLREGLREGEPVTRAIHEAGFGSASRVYEKVATRLGMTPKQYRAGGAGVAISHASAQTPLGLLMMGATDRGLCFVQFGDSEAQLLEMLRAEYPGAALAPMGTAMQAQFAAWMQALGEHLSGAAQAPELPLDLRGTAFQMKVWAYLQRIPAGELRSYTEVAEAIGQPRAVRAVASACAANRVALLVPCHRVIRGDGSLGGYKWGLERKRTLIEQERAQRAGTR
ncbi:MAG TPA: bifunctional DNA-binding transcriptional regulator/O6-methylguanine-DNA methyltransferase Ada [Solimonas sp.]|nr:bifunctional DNA-binding transcriptional regulator/O6-methylguanine-DNA methyltransferase Ada [Solimonas sp.]